MKTVLEYVYRMFLSCKAMISWALAIFAMFAILNALGWREFTSVTSGTFPHGATAMEASVKALAYMAAYFGSVLVAPVLIIAAAIRFGLEQVFRVSKGVR
ncbi:MAG TPA: hypothetical protein VI282_07260 [Verrucomicrobiae bacterium]